MDGGRTSVSAAEALDRVRRRVGAIAFFSVAVHGVLGTVGVALVLADQGRADDAWGLLVMSGIIAALTFTGVRLILGRTLWSPVWMLVALTPTAAGAYVLVAR